MIYFVILLPWLRLIQVLFIEGINEAGDVFVCHANINALQGALMFFIDACLPRVGVLRSTSI